MGPYFKNELYGIVLCGGKSSRMGSDKGLLQDGGRTWSEIALENLRPFCARVVLSVNRGQVDSYLRKFPAGMLMSDDPQVLRHYGGPLAAVLTAHGKFPGRDLLVLACDMPDMDAGCLEELVAAYYRYPNRSCYAYHDGDSFEPLCAIYRRELWHFQPEVASRPLVRSLQQTLQSHCCYGLPVMPANRNALKNYNYPPHG